MPWTPTQTEENILKQDIRSKFNFPENHNSINIAFETLKQATGKKQAHAVLQNVAKFEDLDTLKKYGFGNIKDNSPATIKLALNNAPVAIQQQNSNAHKQKILNDRINGYLITLPKYYKEHQDGKFTLSELDTDKVKEVVSGKITKIAVRYYNGDNKLPPGECIEWYARVGSGRSTEKRFFTKPNNKNIWYTEGGTHNKDNWWVRKPGSGDWVTL